MLLLGPCAAESREQVLATAEQLVGQLPAGRAFVYRAGAWKPRTSPGTFQGAGAVALPWLGEVRARFGVPVATEVATEEHVRMALEAGIDYLWIGARTSANPILVQSLADALATAPQKPRGVLVKNPVNDDWRLWEGNIRRCQASGVPVMAVHRGCGHEPHWEMAYRLRQTMPEVPLLLDPSHMAGKTAGIAPLVAVAGRLQYAGLMVEVHCRPAEALSDAEQQLTPAEAVALLAGSGTEAAEESQTLAWLRQMIDEEDERLWHVLLRRMDIVREIGEYKRAEGMAVLQPERYEAIVRRREEWAREHGLSDEAVHTILDAIHREACRVQQ